MKKKPLGIVLIIVGIALAVWGYNIYDSAGSHITRALSGSAPDKAWIGMIVGAICIVLGVSKVK